VLDAKDTRLQGKGGNAACVPTTPKEKKRRRVREEKKDNHDLMKLQLQ